MKKINEFTRAMLVLACIITLAFPISCKEGVTDDLVPSFSRGNLLKNAQEQYSKQKGDRNIQFIPN